MEGSGAEEAFLHERGHGFDVFRIAPVAGPAFDGDELLSSANFHQGNLDFGVPLGAPGYVAIPEM